MEQGFVLSMTGITITRTVQNVTLKNIRSGRSPLGRALKIKRLRRAFERATKGQEGQRLRHINGQVIDTAKGSWRKVKRDHL